jgi:hypothetical protein
MNLPRLRGRRLAPARAETSSPHSLRRGGWGHYLAGAVHALLIHPLTARRVHATDPADVLQQAARATTFGTFPADGAADIAWEAGALAWAALVAWAAHLVPVTADALPAAQALRQTADTAGWCAHRPALAGAIDFAATTVADDPVTASLAKLAAGFRTALAVLPFPVMLVIVGVMTSTVAATTDDGPITTATRAARDRQGGDRGDVADRDRERGDQTAQRQPA